MAELPYTPGTGTRCFIDAICWVSSGEHLKRVGRKRDEEKDWECEDKEGVWGKLVCSLTLNFQSISGSGVIETKGSSAIALVFPQTQSNQYCITLAWWDGTVNLVVFSMHHQKVRGSESLFLYNSQNWVCCVIKGTFLPGEIRVLFSSFLIKVIKVALDEEYQTLLLEDHLHLEFSSKPDQRASGLL